MSPKIYDSIDSLPAHAIAAHNELMVLFGGLHNDQRHDLSDTFLHLYNRAPSVVSAIEKGIDDGR